MFTHPRISTSPHPPDSYPRPGSLRLDDFPSSSFGPWDNQPRQPPNFLSMSESDFPALGQRKPEAFSSLSRAPNSPSQPSRPHSLSDHQVLEFPNLPMDSPFTPQLSLPTHRAYVGSLSTKAGDPPSEFTLDKNDFPTLDRGAPAGDIRSKLPGSSSMDDDSNRGTFDPSPFDSRMPGLVPGLIEKDSKSDERYRTLINQRPTGNSGSSIQYDQQTQQLVGIPSSMLTDKHSFLGCTKILKEVLGDKREARNLQSFDLDKNLTDMGLSFVKGNSNRLIYRFQSPFAEMPCRVQDIDMFVPNEYLTNIHIREKLAEIRPDKYSEELLFWIFYSNPNDHMQTMAANELYKRLWKYHIEEKIWLTRPRNIDARVKNQTYEEGTFMVWDTENWKKVARDLKVEYSKLHPNEYQPAQHRTSYTEPALNPLARPL